MDIGGSSSVQRAERFIRQVCEERQSRGVQECDQDTAIAGALLLAEVEANRDAAFAKVLIERIYRGQMRAELLAEEDVDDARGADPTRYANHIGDYLFHLNQGDAMQQQEKCFLCSAPSTNDCFFAPFQKFASSYGGEFFQYGLCDSCAESDEDSRNRRVERKFFADARFNKPANVQ